MGKEEDLAWVLKEIEANPKIQVLSSSLAYQMQGTRRFKRRYIEVERLDKDQETVLEGRKKKHEPVVKE